LSCAGYHPLYPLPAGRGRGIKTPYHPLAPSSPSREKRGNQGGKPQSPGVRAFRKLFFVVGLVGLLAVGLAGVASSDFTSREWEYSKPISLQPGVTVDEFVQVRPDIDVYTKSVTGLADLRIIETTNGIETPYKLLVERGERRRQSVSAAVQDLGISPNGDTSFVVRTGGSGALHSEVEILTASRNFQRAVRVEGSDDLSQWSVLQAGAQIYDVSVEGQPEAARSTRVTYPVSSARYIRVTIQNNGQPPLEIRGVSAFLLQAINPAYREYASSITSRAEDAGQKASRLVVDLGRAGLPSSRVEVSTPNVNFFREVRIETSGDAREWTEILSGGAIFSYDTPLLKQQGLGVDYPETTDRYLRVTVLNRDNAPLEVTGVKALGFERRLIFQAKSGDSYALHYGNPAASAPSYDIEQLFPYLVTENLREGGLGAEVVNTDFEAKPTEPFSERYPWLLPLVVALAALGLGAFLAMVLRQARRAQASA